MVTPPRKEVGATSGALELTPQEIADVGQREADATCFGPDDGLGGQVL